MKKSAVRKPVKDLLGEWTFSDAIKEINHRALEIDIVAISCCIHRLHDVFLYDFTDPAIIGLVTKKDYDLADTIKTYYQQKLLLSALKGNKLSAFRADLSMLINNSFYVDGREQFIYPDKMLGLAYRLPQFYEYDIEIEKMFGGQYSEVNHGTRYDYTGELVFVHKLVNKQKRRSAGSQEYWFKNSYDEMVVIATDRTNKLIPFFEREITKKNIKVSADLFLRYKDNIQYYLAIDWRPIE